ncbi:phosphatase PAP2 family protein [Hydrogenophaga sp.]|uniref:phosphatase PAP2 family protein n=1 Tax=Hydrogenophaga sp. TaxID=1904254 RepID=UPI0035670451
MTNLHDQLFLWINLSAQTPPVWLALVRLCSTALPPSLLLGVLLTVALGRPGVRCTAVHMLAAMALAWLLAHSIAGVWPMPRPFALGLGQLWLEHKNTPGFPSSHASVAWAFAAAGWWRLSAGPARWRPVRWVFPALALLISWSRVALGVHFPFDVLAGAAVGVLAAALGRPLVRRLLAHLGRGFADPARLKP